MSANALRDQMAAAWGGDAAWFTTGSKVADLVAEAWLPEAAADERARIVWWLRAGIDGPAAVSITPGERALLVYLADVIEQDPERFAEAPTGRAP